MDAHSSSTSMVVYVLEDTLDSHPINPSAASHADSLLVLADSSTRSALPLLTLELYEAQQLLLASSETKYDLQVQIAEELELELSRKAEEVRVLRRQLEDARAEKERVSTDAQRLRKEVEQLKAQDVTKEVRSQLRSDHRKFSLLTLSLLGRQVRIVHLVRSRDEVRERLDGVEIALESKQQELELVRCTRLR